MDEGHLEGVWLANALLDKHTADLASCIARLDQVLEGIEAILLLLQTTRTRGAVPATGGMPWRS